MQRTRWVGGLLSGAMLVAISAQARASTLDIVESQVTDTETWEDTPTLGNDGVSDLVVYSQFEQLSSGPAPGDVYFQRITNGVPDPVAVQVTTSPTNDIFNDVSGDYIVYTAYDTFNSGNSGEVMVYRISTGERTSIGNALTISGPRISGHYVVWRRAVPDSVGLEVVLYDLEGTGEGQPLVLQGPVPFTYYADIGDRFVVWAEPDEAGYTDIAAYDLTAAENRYLRITSTPGVNERQPATSGSIIVWQAQDLGAQNARIEARDVDSDMTWVLADDGAFCSEPSIDGDLVAYQSNLVAPDNNDIYVTRISTGETFQVTTDPAHQFSPEIFGNLVTWVDRRSNGNQDIYLSQLDFSDTDSPVPWITDPEGLCATEGLPDGVVELFDESWQAPESCSPGRRNSYWIDERYDIAVSPGSGAVLCLRVDGTAGPGQSHAPKGFVTWNEETVFDNVSLRSASSATAAAALESNALRVKLKLRGPHYDSVVEVRVLEVAPPEEPDAAVEIDPSWGGCAAAPGGTAALAVLGLLGLARRRRR